MKMNFKKTADDFEVGECVRLYNWKDAHAAAVKCGDVLTGDIEGNIHGIPKNCWLQFRENKLKVMEPDISRGSVRVSKLDGSRTYYVPAYLVYKVKGDRK